MTVKKIFVGRHPLMIFKANFEPLSMRLDDIIYNFNVKTGKWVMQGKISN